MTEGEFFRLAIAQVDRLTAFAARLSRDRSSAEDLVHEAFIHALACRHQLQARERFLPWMMSILRTRFLKAQRKNRHRLTLIENEPALSNPPIGNLEDELTSRDLSDELARALESLPEEWCTSLLLCDVEGLSYEEIAIAMECPIGTVRSRIARARARLLEFLSASRVARRAGEELP